MDIEILENPLEFLRCGSSLSHHGLLGSVNGRRMHNVDLSPVPAQPLLASLALCVTYIYILIIENVSGCCDMVSLFTSLKYKEFEIWNQREETRALVEAMESGVKKVVLWSEVTLEWVCREVDPESPAVARSSSWSVSRDGGRITEIINRN